jgi:hypothetical protein
MVSSSSTSRLFSPANTHYIAAGSEQPEYPSSKRVAPSLPPIGAPALLEKTFPAPTLSPRSQNFAATYKLGDTPSPTVADTQEPKSLLGSPYLPAVDPNRHPSAQIKCNNLAPTSTRTLNTVELESAIQVILKIFGSESPSNSSPSRPSADPQLRASTVAHYDLPLSSKIKSYIRSFFTERVAADVVGKLEEMIDAAVENAQDAHSQIEADIHEAAEEGYYEVTRIRDECIHEMETMACDGQTRLRDGLREIVDKEMERFYLTGYDWQSSQAKSLVSERSRLEKEKRKLRKEKKRLKMRKEELKRKGKRLKQQEKRLRCRETNFANDERAIQKIDDGHQRKQRERMSETEDE